MRRFLVPALLASLLGSGGCFVSREFSNFSAETGRQFARLGDGVTFDAAYMNDLNRPTTRVGQRTSGLRADVDRLWKDLYVEQRPPAPIALPPARPEPAGTFIMPIRPQVVPPPRETVIERLQGTDMVIIRSPDGAVTVTNLAEAARPGS